MNTKLTEIYKNDKNVKINFLEFNKYKYFRKKI